MIITEFKPNFKLIKDINLKFRLISVINVFRLLLLINNLVINNLDNFTESTYLIKTN